MGPCEQPVDAARAFPITTEVDTASVRNRRRVAAVPLLDHAHPVIDVVRRGASDPTAPAPCVIDTPAQSAQTVIREIDYTWGGSSWITGKVSFCTMLPAP